MPLNLKFIFQFYVTTFQKYQPDKGSKVRRERERRRGERDRETPMNNSTKREKNDGYISMYFESLCMHVC